MDTHVYPGQGLSLSQIAFALNEELKRVAYSSSFTFDDVSQLDGDISIASANIREWRNSFVQINRIPLDVVSLIPNYLPYVQDRLKATHVCRHWRRTFLRHATLWSQLLLPKGETCVSTFLERAKGSTPEVITSCKNSAGTMALLSPHTQQIGSLYIMYCPWADIQRFSDVISGPLPLLRTLEINLSDILASAWQPGPSLPLFGRAVDVERFVLRTVKSPFLNHFVFPNLTTLELSTRSGSEGLRASEILNFLEASPTLRTVCMTVIATILLEGVTRTRVVVLPNVQTFSLDMSDGWRAYELVAHISCPSASRTLLTHEKKVGDINTNHDLQDMFPTATSWNAIVDQFTRGPIETVTLEIKTPHNSIVACTLTFQSSDTTFTKLDLEVSRNFDMGNQFRMSVEEMVREALSRASAVIQCHPLLRGTRCLRILDRTSLSNTDWLESVADETRTLIDSIEFLEELTLHGCDLRLCLNHYIDAAELGSLPLKLKELTISHPLLEDYDEEECLAVIVELAKLQHMQEAPIQRVTVLSDRLPSTLAGMLEPWVGVVVCRRERCIALEDY